MKVIDASEFGSATRVEDADVVVIGSGAGGAVMAYELSRAGYRVVVLEAGPHIASSAFNEHFPDAMEQLYADAGTQLNADGDINILQGRCVGGSTVVNAVVTFPIPDWVLDDWSARGVHGLSAKELAPLYQRLQQNLSIHSNQLHEINRNSQLMEAGAQALGWSVKPLSRNVRDCALSGYCLSGCRYDRKQSMLVTYLPWAQQLGAKIYAGTEVRLIATGQGRATGVEAVVTDHESGQQSARLRVSASAVVVAAGAIQSPLLLQDNGLGGAHVGHHLACHPALSLMALFDEPVHMWQGAQMGVYVDEFDADERGGFLLEGGGIEPTVIGHSLPGNGPEHAARMSRADRLASMVELIHDKNVGRVWRKDGLKRIDYRLAQVDKRRIRQAITAAARIWFAAGAREVYVPTQPTTVLRSVADLAMIDVLPLRRNDLIISSFHPQGTCRMGEDPTQSVVNSYGQVHGFPNLVVADASVFPTSVLVNTQLPVYVTASRIAEHMKSEPERYGLA